MRLNIGTKIIINATVHKDCDFKTPVHRFRKRIACKKIGYVVGLRKKMLKWSIELAKIRRGDLEPYDESLYAQPVESGMVVEFKERLAGKSQEALLSDIELWKSDW